MEFAGRHLVASPERQREGDAGLGQYQRDRDRGPELVRNDTSEVAAVGNSREALVALVDAEIIQLAGILG